MTTTSQDLNALFKEVYRDKVENLVPEGIQLLKDIPFSEQEKIGESLQVAVRASDEANFTFTNDTVSAVALNEAIPARYLTAEVVPTTIVLRAQLSYQQAAKTAAKKKAIEVGTQQIFDSLKLTMDRKLEDVFFNGSEDIFPLDEVDRRVGNPTRNPDVNIVAGTDLLRFVTAMVPLWDAGEDTERIANTEIEIYVGALGGLEDRPGVSQGDRIASGIRIKSINADRRTLTLDTTNVVLGGTTIETKGSDVLRFIVRGEADHSLLGLEQLLTTTDNLYGIPVNDVSGYFTPGAYEVGGALTVDHIVKAAEVAVPNGLEGRAVLYVNTAAFNNPVSYTHLTLPTTPYV